MLPIAQLPLIPVSRLAGLLTLLFAFAGSAQAQESFDYRPMALEWARNVVPGAAAASGASLRMEVSVGSLDSRLKLAPCGNVEPYIPPGVRMWGKTRIGLRCVDGVSRWNVSLPVTVQAFGNAWVMKSQLAPGSVITQADVVQAEVDWAEESSPVLINTSSWVGQIASRPLVTGQTLRQGMVKAAQAFQAGTQVRVVAQGVGFQVTGDAQALSAGVVGQLARVRMENGRVASGTELDARTVKIDI
jgi:flagella basal body P-ring formation protein FlgA